MCVAIQWKPYIVVGHVAGSHMPTIRTTTEISRSSSLDCMSETLPKETFYMPISVAISTLWQIAWSSPPSKFLPLPQCLVGHESSNNLLQPKGISSIHQCGPLMFVSLSSSLDAFMMRIKRSKVWRWGYRFRFRQHPVELVQMLCEFHSWCYLKCILHFFKNRFVCILDSYLCAKLKG